MIVALIAILLAPCFVMADMWSDYDSASPLLIRYNGGQDSTGTIAVIATLLTITDDGNATTMSMATGTTTVADMYTAITTATNTSGKKNFQALYSCALAADIVTTNYLVVATNTLNKEWDNDIKWDTSSCLHYDVPITAPSPFKGHMGTKTITGIYGSPDGTGNVTVNLYVDGNRRYGRVYTSPIYIPGEVTGSTTQTNATENGIYPAINFVKGIRIGSERAFARMGRATTATTGGIGVDQE